VAHGDEVGESSDTEICFLSALELRERYERRELSPVEVAEAILRRIEHFNPRLVAFITVTADLALDQARAAERAYGLGGNPGLLAGIPVSLKDLTPTKGIRTTRGSLLYEDWIPAEDSPFAERAHAAGAVLLGKTNTPEFGWKADTTNRIVGSTHNPWQYGMTAGGSSGGAAAAVAAGMGPLAQGSDGGGSIRIPSSYCGIFGHKPSFGLVPQFPPSAFGDLSHLGPMTRSVRDAALFLAAIAGGDPRDRLSWSSGINYVASCDGGITGLRVAWSPDLGYATLDPAVREATERAARRFEDLGCHVEEAGPGLGRPDDIWWKLWISGNAAVHIDDFDRVRDQIDPGRIPLIEQGRELTGPELAQQQILRNAYYTGMQQFMERYDLLLTPTMATTAFPAGHNGPTEIAGKPMAYGGDWAPFCSPFNLTGQPAATVPCGFDEAGLPIGLQIVGRWHDDATVLRASAAFETVAPWMQHRPPLDDTFTEASSPGDRSMT
jgi:Asp-tRNA(Asn)/Glu-tRNA(Gln) amidotransferase A subunit family amidase